jgi:hypothetical protein
VAELDGAGEIVKRALGYPYATPRRSFIQLGDRTLIPPPRGPDLRAREPLLAYGANAAPEALARKLAPLPDEPLPVLRAELDGYDVVYSAHVSPHGAVPATLHPSPGTTVRVFVAYPTEQQRQLLTETEPNYEPTRLTGISLRLAADVPLGEAEPELAAADAYLSRHGCLALGEGVVALAAIAARGRGFGSLHEPAVLERVRAALAPELSLDAFVRRCVESGGVAPLPRL